jgi:hypothetical protein
VNARLHYNRAALSTRLQPQLTSTSTTPDMTDIGVGKGKAIEAGFSKDNEVITNDEHRIPRFKFFLALLERDAIDIVVGRKQKKRRKKRLK